MTFSKPTDVSYSGANYCLCHITKLSYNPLTFFCSSFLSFLAQTGPDKNTEVDYGSADQDQIQLVLRILAMLCDGQNSDLQVCRDYFHENGLVVTYLMY